MSILQAKEITLPKNTVLEEPLCLRGSEAIKIVAQENTQALVIQLYLEGEPQSNTEIVLGRNANVTHAVLMMNGSLKLDVTLAEERAQFSSQVLMLPRENQCVSISAHIHHQSPETQSSLIARAAVDDEAKSSFAGKIIVDRKATNTNALLENKNLLLSDKASAKSFPEFEIDNGEISCKHGATIGHLENDALFYLSSRGIPLDRARQLLISAFLQPVLQHFAYLKIPLLQQFCHEYA